MPKNIEKSGTLPDFVFITFLAAEALIPQTLLWAFRKTMGSDHRTRIVRPSLDLT